MHVGDGQRRGGVQLDGELNPGVVVGRDLRPVDVVEREHRGGIVGPDLEGQSVLAPVDEPGDIEGKARVGALYDVVAGYAPPVDPDIGLADNTVDDQLLVSPASARR